MARRLIAAAFCLVLFHAGARPALGKKKQGKRVQERFYASSGGGYFASSLDIAIEDFSSDRDLEDLQKISETGGEKALNRALFKTKKGFLNMGDGYSTPLVIVQSSPEGTGRVLRIVSLAASGYSESSVHPIFQYPFVVIQLRVDRNGRGSGSLIRNARLALNEGGRLVVKPYEPTIVPLTNVRLEK